MKKNPLYLIIFFISFYTAHGQNITFGITGGVNYSNIGELYHYGPRGGNNVTPSDDAYYTANSDMGYHFGGYLRLNMDYYYLKTEIVYTSLKNNYELALAASNWTQEEMDVGLFFGYKIYYPITIYAGPSISIIDDRQLEGNEIKGGTPWTFEKTNLGINLGITVEYGRFSIDARYLYGLTQVELVEIDMVRSTYGTNRGALLEYNPSQYILSVSIDLFSFGGEKKKGNQKSDWRNHRNL